VEDTGNVPQAVLAFDCNRGKSLARQRFGEKWIGQAAPAGEYRFSGVQAPGEREGRDGHGRFSVR
jgi:hypothetical protein